MSWYREFKPYVPVAVRQKKAAEYANSLAKKEKRTLAPVTIVGRTIAKSFWGKAWCQNLESYSDYSNRLPRGGTYARNGSVIDLQIGKGTINALVSGSSVYKVTIRIETLAADIWKMIQTDCSRSIDSLLDLLQGKFDLGVMERLTQKERGLFPRPKEIQFHCSCPDSASMCKHIAATMYGVGHRLDLSPELLFQLRAVDHLELVGSAVSAENLGRSLAPEADYGLAGSDLGALFGIEMDASLSETRNTATTAVAKTGKKKQTTTTVTVKKSVTKTVKKSVKAATQVDVADKPTSNRSKTQTKPGRLTTKELMMAKFKQFTSAKLPKQLSTAAERTLVAKKKPSAAVKATPVTSEPVIKSRSSVKRKPKVAAKKVVEISSIKSPAPAVRKRRTKS